jgi:NAD(P)-dependent dehydrogenase (short-subunit alcohol dehydrogenase family)
VSDKHSATVLVTGATDGLGRGTAIYLAKRGYRVFAAGRNAQKRASLETEAKKENLALETLEMDVTDDASVDQAVAEIEKRAGPVEILVNNAGIAIVAAMEEISQSDLHKQFETNFFGLVRVTQRVLPAMRESRRGRIINLSSVAGKMASPLFGPYAGSKHAVEGISDAMRVELVPFGVQVILIEPGYIPSNMEASALELSSSYVAKAPASPYAKVYEGFQRSWGRISSDKSYTPEDCARVILRAIQDRRPKVRYPVTKSAYVIRWMKRLLSDRTIDRIFIHDYGLQPPGN